MRSLARALAAVTATLALFVAPVTAASAAPGGLEFSRDGITWQTSTPATVFASALVLAPGVSQTATWYLRNGHTGGAQFTAVISDVTWSSVTASEIFHLSARDGIGGGFTDTAIGEVPQCAAATSPRMLQPGEIAAVTVTVGIPATVDGTTGFNEAMNFALGVALTEPTATVGAGGCPVNPITIPGVPSRGGSAGAGTATPGEDGFEPRAAGSSSNGVDGVDTPGIQVVTTEPAIVGWVYCGVLAFASGGAPASAPPACTETASSAGIVMLLGIIFVMLATIWFLILWRRRHRDDDEQQASAPTGGTS